MSGVLVKERTLQDNPVEVDLAKLFSQLPQPADQSAPEAVLPIDHYDRPVGGYRIVGDTLEKWVPVYEAVVADSALEVAVRLSGNYTPKQLGWKLERRAILKDCHCTNGKYEVIHGKLVHTDGCGRSRGNTGESVEDFHSRVRSIQSTPSDDYLNGMYPTLGGRDQNDPSNHITRGRSEYRQRTKGMITWGSSSKDDASWNGGTLKALDAVKARNEKAREAALHLKVERYSKKMLPRKMGEL